MANYSRGVIVSQIFTKKQKWQRNVLFWISFVVDREAWKKLLTKIRNSVIREFMILTLAWIIVLFFTTSSAYLIVMTKNFAKKLKVWWLPENMNFTLITFTFSNLTQIIPYETQKTFYILIFRCKINVINYMSLSFSKHYLRPSTNITKMAS